MWASYDYDGMVEIVPLEDEREHFLGDECWCEPEIEYIDGVPVVSHNALDGRD